MTVINPPGFLQNAGATHTAEQFRNWHGLLLAGKATSTSLIPRGGINPALGNQLQVTQTGSPSQAVIVKSGHAMIPGSEGSKQGAYSVMNDADVTLSVTAAHATLNRIDSVVFKVQDTAYSGATNTSSLVMVDGTPASSPSPPTLPANSIELARVSVLAASTSVVNASITDMRQYLAAVGGIMVVKSTTRPAAGTVTAGQIIYETDTTSILRTDDGGTSWHAVNAVSTATVATTENTSSAAYTDLATVGPSVTVTTGTSVKVTFVAFVTNASVATNAVSVAVSGATTIAASDIRALNQASGGRAAMVCIITGLTPGSNTFTLKYKTSSGTASYLNRDIIVEIL